MKALENKESDVVINPVMKKVMIAVQKINSKVKAIENKETPQPTIEEPIVLENTVAEVKKSDVVINPVMKKVMIAVQKINSKVKAIENKETPQPTIEEPIVLENTVAEVKKSDVVINPVMKKVMIAVQKINSKVKAIENKETPQSTIEEPIVSENTVAEVKKSDVVINPVMKKVMIAVQKINSKVKAIEIQQRLLSNCQQSNNIILREE